MQTTKDDGAPIGDQQAMIAGDSICSECHEKCLTPDQLEEHVAIMHLGGWMRYQCLHCLLDPTITSVYYTATVDQLKAHFRRLHPHQPFMKLSTPDADKKRRLREILTKSVVFVPSRPAPRDIKETVDVGCEESGGRRSETPKQPSKVVLVTKAKKVTPAKFLKTAAKKKKTVAAAEPKDDLEALKAALGSINNASSAMKAAAMQSIDDAQALAEHYFDSQSG